MYVISYQGVFTYGYVKNSFSLRKLRNKTIPFDTHQEALYFATKFRFKIIADFYCWLYNFNSKMNYDFQTFKVEKI